MAVTSLRRKLSASAAAGLLLVPGCNPVDEALPYADTIHVPLDDMSGVEGEALSVAAEHSTVGYQYPRLGESHPLMVEIRTTMAERQTDFMENLPDRGHPELQQDASFLAASPEVIGARVTATTSAGMRERAEGTTLWYATDRDTVLPWTSLFSDEEAIKQAHLAIAEVLEEGYNVPLEQLPGVVGEVALQAQEDPDSAGAGEREAGGDGAAESAAADPLDLADPEQALEAAGRWEGSPLEDVAFSSAGGLTVRMDPSDVPGAGQIEEVLIPVEAEETETLLSNLGYQSRDAAVSGDTDADFPLNGELSTQGNSLDCERLKCVALTFDDGPAEYTDELMDTLQEYDARATFYVLGSLVEEHPEALERMVAEGHELGNHTWEHDDLAEMSGEEVKEDISRTNEAVREVVGVDPPTVRPPYGSLNGTVRDSVDQPIVLWDVDTMDWESRNTEAISAHALEHSTAGSVVLFHDIHETSVAAIPDVLEGLHRAGFHFVTVTDIFGFDGMDPGDVYTDARID